MAKFDIYPLKSVPHSYVMEIQASILSDSLKTRVVIPLRTASQMRGRVVPKFHPSITLGDIDYVLVIPELTVIQAKDVGEVVASRLDLYDDIRDALDFLFYGF